MAKVCVLFVQTCTWFLSIFDIIITLDTCTVCNILVFYFLSYKATKAVIDKEANGLSTAMLTGSLQITPLAMLGR